jgi:hypothetical protein
MTINFSGMHHISQGERLYEPINDLLIILAALTHAASLMLGGTTHRTPKPTARIGTRQFDYDFVIPLRGPLEHALHDTKPGFIDIGMTKDRSPIPNVQAETKGLDRVGANITAPIFLTYFEPYNQWLDTYFGRDTLRTWPASLKFGRIVRNSIAHHGIDIRDPAAPSAGWRNLSYSYANQGARIIGTDMRLGDILGLMFEIDDDLDLLGAPVL